MKSKKMLIIGGLVVVALLGLGATGIVLAEEEGTDSSPPFFEDLAEKLGLQTSDVCSAVKEVQLDKLKERYEDGDIEEDVYNERKAEIEDSECGVRPRGPQGPGNGMGPVDIEKLSEFLGLSEDEIKAAREEGKTIHDLAEEQGISDDELKEFMEENRPDGLPPRRNQEESETESE